MVMPSPRVMSYLICQYGTTFSLVKEVKTHSLSDGGDGLLARQDAHIIPVPHDSVVGAASEVGERLSGDDIGVIEQRLSERGDIRNDIRRVNTLEDVVRKKGANGDGIVAELDCLALRDISRDVRESLVGRRNDGDIASRRQSIRKTVNERNKLQQGAQVVLRLEK